MIGNTIEFLYYDWSSPESILRSRGKEAPIKQGLVVDAFTEIKGRMKGSAESFLGIGSGSAIGKTDSKRIYKVEYYEYSYAAEKKTPKYIDIYAWQMKRIISFAGQTNQEVHEEKIKVDE